MSKPREREVERALRRGVETLGGICEKHVSPGRNGVPDRLVTLPVLGMRLVETKAPNGVLSKLQILDHAQRRALGVRVYVAHTVDQVAALLAAWRYYP